jgi:hypothetical protein
MITARLLLALVIASLLFNPVMSDSTANTTITVIIVTPTPYHSHGGGGYSSSTFTPIAEPTDIVTTVPEIQTPGVTPIVPTLTHDVQTTTPTTEPTDVPTPVELNNVESLWDYWWIVVILLVIIGMVVYVIIR